MNLARAPRGAYLSLPPSLPPPVLSPAHALAQEFIKALCGQRKHVFFPAFTILRATATYFPCLIPPFSPCVFSLPPFSCFPSIFNPSSSVAPRWHNAPSVWLMFLNVRLNTRTPVKAHRSPGRKAFIIYAERRGLGRRRRGEREREEGAADNNTLVWSAEGSSILLRCFIMRDVFNAMLGGEEGIKQRRPSWIESCGLQKKNMIMPRFSGKYSSERFLFGDGQGSGFVAPV